MGKPKEKIKAKKKKKEKKNSYVNKTHGYEMMINNNEEDYHKKGVVCHNEEDYHQKVVVCHKSTSDKGALGYEVWKR
jgi:hypothetical protein